MPDKPNAEVEQWLPQGTNEINDLVTFNGQERVSEQPTRTTTPHPPPREREREREREGGLERGRGLTSDREKRRLNVDKCVCSGVLNVILNPHNESCNTRHTAGRSYSRQALVCFPSKQGTSRRNSGVSYYGFSGL